MAAILPKRSADNIDAAVPPPPPAFRRAHTQGGGAKPEDALDKKLRLARENAMAKIHPPPKPEYVRAH